MSDILVLGGGFAGVWAAAGAARLRHLAGIDESELGIRVVAPGDDLVIRPRLYQASPDNMRVPLDRIFGPIGVDHVAATATTIDTQARRVRIAGERGQSDLPYERLVIATGSEVVRPTLPGAEHLHNVDTAASAVALDRHLHDLPLHAADPGRLTAVVVGAGFTGVEVATELVGRLRAIAGPDREAESARVVLVEREDVVGPELGPRPRPIIMEALEQLGIEVRLRVSLAAVERDRVWLDDGSDLRSATVVWTAGMRASRLTADVPAARDELGRLEVDPHLRVTSVRDVFAAGDTASAYADTAHRVTQSCQHAIPQGKYAGHNAVADLMHLPLARFVAHSYVTCLDLGTAGAVFTTGWERSVRATGSGAKAIKRKINEEWIYPPLDRAEEIFRRADYNAPSQADYDAVMGGADGARDRVTR